MYFLTLLLSFTISLTAFSQTNAFHEKQWLNLLRYNKGLFGYKSEVDSKDYFFSKEGKRNPEAEWKATIEAFKKPMASEKDLDKHPICRFPGRYLYMKSKGHKVPDFPLQKCGEFQKFSKRLNLDSVSLIFSSYYINKPASAFGHTLLKVKNKDSTDDNQLLDYGVDFSAAVTTNNPILYGIYGIIGGFHGRFNLMPYFLKLREYNDYESRDLWEFELNLTEEQKQLFVAHLWDMDKAHFNYYYFSENCSYHISRFLDAIMPDDLLIEDLSSTVAPIDTLMPFFEGHRALKKVNYRPSLRKKLKHSYEKLADKDQDYILKAIKTKKIEELDKLKDPALTLDTLSQYIDYKYPDQIQLSEGDDVKKVQNFKFAVLSKRSKLKDSTKEEPFHQNVEIKKAHKSKRFRLGYGRNSGQSNISNLEYRFSLHGLEDLETWYNPNASLEMGNVQLQYVKETSRLELKEAQLANVIALRPVDKLFKDISWNFTLGATHLRELEKNRVSPQLDVGVGYAKKFSSIVVAAFAQANQRYTSLYDDNYRFDLGLRGILKAKFKRFNFVSDYTYTKVLTKQHNLSRVWENTLNYALSTNFSLSLHYEDTSFVEKGYLNFNFYL